MKKYIHYGYYHFNRKFFLKIRNNEYLSTKPLCGGLWASPIDNSGYNWKDYVEEGIINNHTLNASFTFHLDENAKLLYIDTIEALKDLPTISKQEPEQAFNFYGFCSLPKPVGMEDYEQVYLDFEKLSEQYDAIEVSFNRDNRLKSKLYGWDCNSILIFNPDIIIEDAG